MIHYINNTPKHGAAPNAGGRAVQHLHKTRRWKAFALALTPADLPVQASLPLFMDVGTKRLHAPAAVTPAHARAHPTLYPLPAPPACAAARARVRVSRRPSSWLHCDGRGWRSTLATDVGHNAERWTASNTLQRAHHALRTAVRSPHYRLPARRKTALPALPAPPPAPVPPVPVTRRAAAAYTYRVRCSVALAQRAFSPSLSTNLRAPGFKPRSLLPGAALTRRTKPRWRGTQAARYGSWN